MNGFVKLHRQIIKWEWYTDSNTKSLFLHCLLLANHSPRKWMGVQIEAGSFVTSTLKLADELHMTRQMVRTSLERLKSTNEITIKTTNKFTVISVVKWGDYQGFDVDEDHDDNQLANHQLTNKQPTNNQQITTNKNDKNEKNEKNSIKDTIEVNIPREDSNSRYVGLSLEDSFELIKKKPFTEPLTEEEIRIVRLHDKVKIPGGMQ